MRLVAFTDFHADIGMMKRITAFVKKTKPDVVVCCGDMTVFEQHIVPVINWLGRLHKNVILVHGNHETPERVRALCAKQKTITFIHKSITKVKEITFIGWGGGGFAIIEPDFEQFAKKIGAHIQNKKVVLVTHAPPHGTKLDHLGPNWGYVGNKSITNFIRKNQNVALALFGHLHEHFGKKDRLGKTIIVNPGPMGMLIEV